MARNAKTVHPLDKMADDFCDAITSPIFGALDQIPELSQAQYNAIVAAVDSAKLAALDLYLEQAYGREKDRDEAEDKILQAERKLEDVLLIAQNAKDEAPLALLYHDDAVKYGWADRDAEAWNIVAGIFADVEEMARVQA